MVTEIVKHSKRKGKFIFYLRIRPIDTYSNGTVSSDVTGIVANLIAVVGTSAMFAS